MNTITKKWLLEHKASPDLVIIFLKEWPLGMCVTRESLQILGLHLGWLVQELALSDSARAKISQIGEMEREKYRLEWAAANVALQHAKALAHAEFVRIMTINSAKDDQSVRAKMEYDQAIAAAYAEKYRRTTPVQAEYERSMATVRIEAILHSFSKETTDDSSTL